LEVWLEELLEAGRGWATVERMKSARKEKVNHQEGMKQNV